MKIIPIGVGSAFSTTNYNACILLEIGTHKMLLDAGSDLKYMLRDANVKTADIDAVFISHLHNDHVGGLEYLGFMNYFVDKKKAKLFGDMNLLHNLWDHTLKGGMESLEAWQLPEGIKVGALDVFFDAQPLMPNESFDVGGVTFEPVQTTHITNGYYQAQSFGLVIKTKKNRIFWTADTQFAPSQIRSLCQKVDLIIHDCETGKFKSQVHAHYDDLRTFDEKTRKKIALIHYGDNPQQKAEADGFYGFLKQGQVIEVE